MREREKGETRKRWSVKNADRQTDRQTEKRTNRQTDTERQSNFQNTVLYQYFKKICCFEGVFRWKRWIGDGTQIVSMIFFNIKRMSKVYGRDLGWK